MKLHFLVVGKTVNKHLNALILDYTDRIGHYLPFEMEVLPEVKNSKSLNVDQQKQKEADMLKKAFRDGDWVILLDEGGREFRSVDFSVFLERKQVSVPRRLVFVVGGPYGFAPEIYALAKEKISLSKMTFSHQMVRLIFVEQVYRAMTILRGEPYHHE